MTIIGKKVIEMNVGELIKELKQYPKKCLVGVAMHDNSDNEVASLVRHITFLKKKEIDMNYPDCDCVVLRC